MEKRESEHYQPVTPYILARVVVAILSLVLVATFISLLLDISSAYILVQHGHLSAGFGAISPKPNSLLITSRSLVEYPLAISAVIAIVLVTKAAYHSSKSTNQSRHLGS